MDRLRIVFMGTPEFAVASLRMLVENGCNVIAVVTAPDKPQGRGQKVFFSPVKMFALGHDIPVLQPSNLKSPEFQQQLRALQADLQVVVAFRMLPEAVWSLPPLGTFNLHASLLPQYRGAAPIHWAIIHGEKETGVTTFFLRHDIDTGNIIFQEKESIHEDDNAGTLHGRLMEKGARLVLKTVRAIEAGNYPVTPQDEGTHARRAPKIFKETCQINWNQPATQVRNFVRGLSPSPGAWSVIAGRTFKIFAVSTADKGADGKNAGEFITDNKHYLYIKTADAWVSVDELQPEGKKRMPVREFFMGNKL